MEIIIKEDLEAPEAIFLKMFPNSDENFQAL